LLAFKPASKIYQTVNGTIHFKSEAPMELIKASSKELAGAIDSDKRQFSFRIRIRSFQGFNGNTQKENFNENYLESDKYPEASFKGKIIEDIDLQKEGTYELRAKGKLLIHGVEQERIIKCNVLVKNNKLQLKSLFTVLLSDHNIPIPKVVYQKLANEIQVELDAQLEAM
jgi:hypothetical protein